MKRYVLVFLFVVLFLAHATCAQDSSSTRLFFCYEHAGCPAVGSEREAQIVAGTKDERKPFYDDWQWYAQIGISGFFAGWDYKTTQDCFHASSLCTEQNPALGKNQRNSSRILLIGTLSLVAQGGITAALWKHGSGKPVGWVATATRAVLHGIHIKENRENVRSFVCPANGTGCVR